MTGHPNALRLIAGGLAEAIRPRPPLPLSKWLSENLVLVDGELAGQLWSSAGAPYLAEIADCLSDDHPCNQVTIRKSQQSGASILAMGWALYVADREPANMIYAVPGIDALRKLNSQKLQPLIDAFQKRAKRTVFLPQTSRSAAGSSTFEKKFAGGYLSLANANAVMDLSSKTAKKGVKDEVSKWENIPGFGDPETLFFGRFTAFRRTKGWKILEISTPEVDTGDDSGETAGHCRIDLSFKRSDQRFWHVTCPHCDTEQVFTFDRFRPDLREPKNSFYECIGAGCVITELDRVLMVRGGRWVATYPDDPSRHPGFHIDAFISLMMSFEAIAEDYRTAQRSEKDRKDFTNVVLGLPYKFRGDAPDHIRLMERREPYDRRRIPAQALMLTAMVDVQHSGLYVEVVAWAPDKRSWTVDVAFIDGDTTDHRRGAWSLLGEFYERTYEDAWGKRRSLDAIGVDAGDGGRVNQVLAWTSARLDAYAFKGEDGWARPAISAQAKLVDITLDGKVQKNGARLWKTGTWSLKREHYDNLRKTRIAADGSTWDPPGFCHFGLWLDEIYFKQITSEYLEDITVRGRVTGRRWAKRGENHYLDCRIGNMALADHLGLNSMSPADWQTLAEMRGVPDGVVTPDLFTPAPIQARASNRAAEHAAPPPAKPESIFDRLARLNQGLDE
ncbi:phage terminase large subunit family protein [Labrys wisconsinensis]|uniref:Phage terminase large subunit GpA-like protein n=1 Tax=Labrys wisconsinensis TaxID=425677 RepID=A0ABU0JEU8_9HYPH|nr:terminase gpA endonuclease subunit [Labrys wisconsinensis]MDQ0472805.1 phage terminase large subunit GpA-like protein [Labrys wisconsinensis]